MNYHNPSLASQPLFVSINIPETAEAHLCLPQNNWIGSSLLSQLLDTTLEAAGQSLQPTKPCGSLNHSLYLCDVRDAHEAAKVVRAALASVLLLPFALIYRYDESELICRNLFPAPGQDATLDDLLRKLAAIQDSVPANLKQLFESSGREKPNPPLNPS